jgi:ATP-dependent DNA helicase RecQ
LSRLVEARTISDVSDDPLLPILRERFGLDDFRGAQRRVIEHLMAGGDAVVVWPTGSGKSLVYQLPALALDAPVIVLSPLIALMQDQVEALRARGVPASFVNSSLDRAERDRRTRDFARGRFRLLYVTPERFRSEGFVAALEGVRVALLAVDEAHCITTWGHDFRPEYGRVGAIRERLGKPPTVALTATATAATIAEIRSKLGLVDPLVDHAGLARPNLFLSVTVAHDEAEKWRRLESLLDRVEGAGIVYGALIRDLLRLEEHLKTRVPGAPLLVYHGELSREERRAMHERFRGAGGPPPRVLATRAFGMGIDRPDLRFLIHAQVPGSLEELWQEVGRAGRDGRPSFCELLYCEQDLPIQMQFVRAANPDRRLFREVARRVQEWSARGENFDLEKLRHAVTGKHAGDGRVETTIAWLAALGAVEGDLERGKLRLARTLAADSLDALVPDEIGPEKEKRDLERLQKMVEYVRGEGCRRALLDAYFGLPPPASANCGACDRCVDREEWLARELPAAETVVLAPIADVGAGRAPQRGDFVRVDGRLLGRVTRVSGKGRDLLVEVELAVSLETRRFPIRRHRIEVLRG